MIILFKSIDDNLVLTSNIYKLIYKKYFKGVIKDN
jgi:hypothetical protein